MSERDTSGGPKGRPRDPAVDDAVRRAVTKLLKRDGYEGLSLEQVAREAGVGKASIYRRWGGKAALVLDVVVTRPDPKPRKGLPAQLKTLVAVALDDMERPEMRAALPGLVGAGLEDPSVWEGVFDAELGLLAASLDVSRAEGELRRGVDAELLFDAYVGAGLVRLMRGEELSSTFRSRLVALLLRGAEVTD